MSLRIASLWFAVSLVTLASHGSASAQESLESRLAAAEADAVVRVENGTYQEPLKLARSVTLKGVSAEESLLSLTADEPALSVTDKAHVVIESMTISWQLASSDPQPGPATAVYVKDAKLTLRNCRLIAEGNGKRCPSGLLADGFSEVTLENCQVEGFEFAVNISGGAQAVVTDSVILRPGHCGITVFSGSELDVHRTIVAHSLYHGLRSTGGQLTATDNLIIQNNNRGIYLGNKSAQVEISGNVILGNGTGISCFAQTAGTIHRNVILDSDYSAIDSRDTCTVSVEGNILSRNTRGFVLFSEAGRNRVTLKANTFWENQTDTENSERPAAAIVIDPQLADLENGQFAAQSQEVRSAGHGLEDAAAVAKLWKIWRAMESAEPGD